MEQAATALPPDETLVALAKRVNAHFPATSRVDFYLIPHDEGRQETGIIYQHGATRAVVKTQAILTEHDAPTLVASLRRWKDGLRSSNQWTTDPREADQ